MHHHHHTTIHHYYSTSALLLSRRLLGGETPSLSPSEDVELWAEHFLQLPRAAGLRSGVAARPRAWVLPREEIKLWLGRYANRGTTAAQGGVRGVGRLPS